MSTNSESTFTFNVKTNDESMASTLSDIFSMIPQVWNEIQSHPDVVKSRQNCKENS